MLAALFKPIEMSNLAELKLELTINYISAHVISAFYHRCATQKYEVAFMSV